MRFLGVGTD